MDIESEHSLKHKKRVKKQKNKKMVGDSVLVKKPEAQSYHVSELNNIIEYNHQNNTQTLLLKGERTEFFVTEDSHRYISQKQLEKTSQNYDYVDPRGYFDSVHFRYVKQYSTSELQQKRLVAEFRNAKDIALNFKEALRLDLSPIRMWQVSLAGAVLFGMVSMSMIYKNLGQSAFAKGVEEAVAGTNDKVAVLVIDNSKEEKQINQEKDNTKENKKTKKETKEIQNKLVDDITKKEDVQDKKQEVKEIDAKKEIVKEIQEVKEVEKSVDSIVKKEIQEVKEEKKNDDEQTDEEEKKVEYSLEEAAYDLVEGYPIEKMLPEILEQDPEVAKYLIAMAKQESAWGKRVPVLNGQDCYNYWGYRGKRKLMGSGGHTCFNSRKDAVETVGKRLHELIYDYDRKTPERLIVWKCGSSCDGHSQEGVNRWINTIKSNYNKLSDIKTISKK